MLEKDYYQARTLGGWSLILHKDPDKILEILRLSSGWVDSLFLDLKELHIIRNTITLILQRTQ